MSILLDTTDAIVTVLNEATLSQSFTATREYVPRVQLKDMDTLHVTVVPITTRGMVVNRGLSKKQYFTLEIGVQQRSSSVDPDDDKDTFDPLVTLVEEIDTLLVGQTQTVGSLTMVGSTKIGGEENDEERDASRTVCLPDHLSEWRQFTSVSRFSFQVVT
jgi:hypothetical protein